MAKFFSLTNFRNITPAPSGSRIRVQHALRYDERGNKYLAEVGTFDQYAYIQSFAASCDVNEIVRRATPEQMAEFKAGIYADTTTLPKTLAESYALLAHVESVFDSLPDKVKQEYGSYSKFLNSFGNIEGVTSFIKKLTPDQPAAAAAQPAESEVNV